MSQAGSLCDPRSGIYLLDLRVLICKMGGAVLRRSVVSESVTPWTVAHQAPLSVGILQTRILERVAMPFSRGSSQTQGSNPGLPHCRQILYQLGHQGSPRILQWVACPFSRASSQPRNRIGVSCFAGRFFTS